MSLLRSGYFNNEDFSHLESLTKLSCCSFPPERDCLEVFCPRCSGEAGIQAFADIFQSQVSDYEQLEDREMSYSSIRSVNGGSAEYLPQYSGVHNFVEVRRLNFFVGCSEESISSLMILTIIFVL